LDYNYLYLNSNKKCHAKKKILTEDSAVSLTPFQACFSKQWYLNSKWLWRTCEHTSIGQKWQWESYKVINFHLPREIYVSVGKAIVVIPYEHIAFDYCFQILSQAHPAGIVKCPYNISFTFIHKLNSLTWISFKHTVITYEY
jgi:hypothetical protein